MMTLEQPSFPAAAGVSPEPRCKGVNRLLHQYQLWMEFVSGLHHLIRSARGKIGQFEADDWICQAVGR